MMTIRFSCGCWFFRRDGEEVANTGDDHVSAAERATGLRVNHVTVEPMDVVAASLGPDAVEAVAAYRATLPQPVPMTEAQKRARYRRELKGF